MKKNVIMTTIRESRMPMPPCWGRSSSSEVYTSGIASQHR